VYAIKVLRSVRRIVERAEQVADSVEAAAYAFERSASPIALIKVVGSIVDKVTQFEKGRKNGKRKK